MEQNKTDKKFAQQPQKKTDMPATGAKSATRPEIDLPLKGGRAESDLSSKTQQPKRDEKRDERSDFNKSSR